MCFIVVPPFVVLSMVCTDSNVHFFHPTWGRAPSVSLRRPGFTWASTLGSSFVDPLLGTTLPVPFQTRVIVSCVFPVALYFFFSSVHWTSAYLDFIAFVSFCTRLTIPLRRNFCSLPLPPPPPPVLALLCPRLVGFRFHPKFLNINSVAVLAEDWCRHALRMLFHSFFPFFQLFL